MALDDLMGGQWERQSNREDNTHTTVDGQSHLVSWTIERRDSGAKEAIRVCKTRDSGWKLTPPRQQEREGATMSTLIRWLLWFWRRGRKEGAGACNKL
ncbi:hypothetical protein BaRGS_00032259 [Batillaria attramentaria]|uniref:Uncharacterized protein n=1 Tax=Batillaria attramentaria TaxID=370345 RepID=A0ABD0JNE8_9CAEN